MTRARVVELRVGNPCSHRRICSAVGACDQEVVTGRYDPLGDGGDLLGGLAGTENDLWKALSGPALVVDSGESDVLEGGLA